MPEPARQSLFDGLYTKGLQCYWRADFVNELSDGLIEHHLEWAQKLPSMPATTTSASRESQAQCDPETSPASTRTVVTSFEAEPIGPEGFPTAMAAQEGRCPEDLWMLVHYRRAGTPHAAFDAWRKGDEFVFDEPPVTASTLVA